MAMSNQKICKLCERAFKILEFEKEFYTKKNLPTPENCPLCRQTRRLSLRNEDRLYKRSCDSCGKNILSTYKEDSPYKVFCHECFWQAI